MLPPDIAEPHYARLAALATAPAAAPADHLPQLRRLLEQVLREECRRREAPFADLSQAIGLVAYDHNLPTPLRRRLQNLRLQANLVLHESYPGTAAEVANGFAAVATLLGHLSGQPYAGPRPDGELEAEDTDLEAVVGSAQAAAATTVASASPVWRVRVLHADLAAGLLTVELAAPAAADAPAQLAAPFGVVLLAAYAGLLPLAAALRPLLHLVGPVRQPDGHYRPRRVVLEPDYLVNVTTLAECAQATGTVPEWALLNAFLPDETSRPLVVGNLVNLLLDEEVSHAARQEDRAAASRQPQFRPVTDRLTAVGKDFDSQLDNGQHSLANSSYQQTGLLLAEAAVPASARAENGASLNTEYPVAEHQPATTQTSGDPGTRHQAPGTQEAPATTDAPTTTEAPGTAEFDLEAFFKKRLFRSNPLTISALPEFQARNGVPELLNDLRRHYQTLRRTRAQGFVAGSRTGYQQQPLRVADCFLEPAFLSATYGLQGRLDLLHESPTGYDIVELKSSSKVPHAEPWSNHAAQAQLYRLLLESVFGADGATAGRGRTSILYSNAAPDQPPVRRVDQDAELVDRLLAARNQLVGTELLLARATTPAQVETLLQPMLQPNLQALPAFGKAKAERVANAWAAADAVERAYCLEWVRFVAREMRLTLLGDEARPGDAGGQAGLWQLSEARKHQNFSLLDGLTLLEDHSHAPDDARDGLGPHLIFQRPAGGREVNFRAGDTLILYPRVKATGSQLVSGTELEAAGAEEVAGAVQEAAEKTTHQEPPEKPPLAAKSLSVLDAQVVKVVLAEDLTTNGQVVLSVRNRRLAPRYLAGHSHWALEPDTYDTFRREWAGLSAFLGLAPERRRRLLARTGPRPPAGWLAATPPATTAPDVVARALAAPDWFVLCGPPGTGKTRAVLRELIEKLEKDDKQTLLAAYTNRAVDEICEQLVAAGLPFIRLGSRLGTAAPYRPYLLDNMIRDCPNRQSVRARLTGCPFYVGTVASLLGRPELFLLKTFDVAVVDEASQVLEGPMLALLAKVPKFILIGDHRQLPAVVAQEPAASAIAPEVAGLLHTELGITNFRNSYFERLFRLAEARWPHAHGTLANHYRMHQELVVLVNDDFYQGQLRCPLPWQHAPLTRPSWPAPADAFERRVLGERLLFVPTQRQPEDASMKESAQEADLAARAAAYVTQGYGPAFNPETTLGIIASYRNQAARIRARLAQLAQELNLPQLLTVSVDTVERYQGSQREVVIVSFCCHHEHQLELMVSPDETGTVDRKLNVALTRARQQLILLGNPDVLRRAPHHAALLRRCGVL